MSVAEPDDSVDPQLRDQQAGFLLVVIDVSHKESREVLHEEIVKALHFFNDKESVLVLNKIDRLSKNPTRLLDITRKLTGGIVRGRRSHIDRYAYRFKRQAKLADTAHHLIPPNELIAARLPAVCHQTTNKFLVYMNNLLAEIESTQVDVDITDSKLLPDNIVEKKSLSDTFLEDRFLTEMEKKHRETFFDCHNIPGNDKLMPSDSQGPDKSKTEINQHLLNTCGESNRILNANSDSEHIDSMLETLKQQLLLQTASPEEVCNRRSRWLEITKSTKGVTKWLGFSEVFMVSSFIGDGIDKLRDFLVSKALPTRSWILPPTIITDQEPSELIRMCVWSHCLNKLQQEIPYSLHIIVDDCDKIKLDSGDDRVYVHVRIRCKNERQLVSFCQ
ncbi:unnamed protein product [Schistosoma mattheei]|uniref:Uncharacterized protein n=1 Tax=Schistosoma mattheei TaxID=31246 RepID=A0A183PPK3_9TREM|nr:unnamed protein product [Schistosoma mattheei]